MGSNVHSWTSLLRWSKINRQSESIALDAGLCMDINQYQSILSAAIWFILLTLCYYKNLIKTVWKQDLKELTRFNFL